MKYIITNTYEGFLSTECETLRAIKPNLITANSDKTEYTLDIPLGTYPTGQFSKVGDTLYSGLQWIGTISSQLNKTLEQETCVYLNHGFAFVALQRYALSVASASLPPVPVRAQVQVQVQAPPQVPASVSALAVALLSSRAQAVAPASEKLGLDCTELSFSLGTITVNKGSQKKHPHEHEKCR